MRITRYPSLTEPEFFGCLSAFMDSLGGELHAAAIALRRLEGYAKGSAFAYEMELDRRRYGALIAIDRWATLVRAFGPHLALTRAPSILTEAADRVAAAENVLTRANALVDGRDRYDADAVEACLLALSSVDATFSEERAAAAQYATLGPMLPEAYQEARRVFLEDLAAR